jgi:hypothetical protein
MAEQEFPRVKVTATRFDGIWSLAFECPKCHYRGRPVRHIHGGGGGEAPLLGHRVTHCPAFPRGYTLEL